LSFVLQRKRGAQHLRSRARVIELTLTIESLLVAGSWLPVIELDITQPRSKAQLTWVQELFQDKKINYKRQTESFSPAPLLQKD
jgi:hypothetical protein